MWLPPPESSAGSSTARAANAEAPPTLGPDGSCPLVPARSDIVEGVQVAGQFPVWRQQNDGRSTWYGANAPPPYEGQIGKTLLYIDKQIQGDLRLSGRQLDGDGVVLFDIVRRACKTGRR